MESVEREHAADLGSRAHVARLRRARANARGALCSAALPSLPPSSHASVDALASILPGRAFPQVVGGPSSHPLLLADCSLAPWAFRFAGLQGQKQVRARQAGPCGRIQVCPLRAEPEAARVSYLAGCREGGREGDAGGVQGNRTQHYHGIPLPSLPRPCHLSLPSLRLPLTTRPRPFC